MDRSTVTEELLRKVIAEETKLPASSFRSDEPFEAYGIESVLIVAITQNLENYFGPLSKTLFFEYQTLNELLGYFLEIHAATLEKIFAVEDKPLPKRDRNGNSSPVLPEGMIVPVAENHYKEITSLPEMQEPKLLDGCRDIAVIGISGCFPKAANIRDFWTNLKEGKDCISEIPEALWDYHEFFDSVRGKEGKSYSKWGGFMDDVDKFDPLFFQMSNLEAESIDPQERLFLQTVYHILNDAGYTRESLQEHKVGVYVGVMWNQYQLYGVEKANAGSSYASIANRVSYFFNFHGPSIGLDTMCSSSLTSVHLACESLLSGETDVAIAGGVNITVHPNKYLFLSKTGFASTDGRCRSFGAGGDGYVPGDGVGALMLKPLSKAVADGDHVYGVIKATIINHGGKVNGYTVPNPKAQASLIAQGLEKANINPRTISYFETHGTGTALGDPIELRGLTTAFSSTGDKQFCSIGSVKSNIGHLESAAGFAGIAKVLMQMKYRQIAPSLHATVLNPNLDFENTPFFVQQELAIWNNPVIEEQGHMKICPRIAGVSSFGAGGANGFVLIEEYIPPQPLAIIREEKYIIPLSALNKERLKACVQGMHDFLESELNAAETISSKPAAFSENSLNEQMLKAIANILNVNALLLDKDDYFQDYDLNDEHYQALNRKIQEFFAVSISESALKRFETPAHLAKYLLKNPVTSNADTGYTAIERIAYTLQTGREHMQERLAIITSSSSELLLQLRAYLQDEITSESIITANISSSKEEKVQDDGFVHRLIDTRKYNKLARLWCSGIALDWKKFYGKYPPVKIPLPGYSFAKERCWVTDPTPYSYSARKQLHPLLHSVDIEATLVRGLTYHSYFTQTDKVFRNHANGDKLVFNKGTAIALLYASASVTREGTVLLKNIQCDDLKVGNPGSVNLFTQVSTLVDGLSLLLTSDLSPDPLAQAHVIYGNRPQNKSLSVVHLQNAYDQIAGSDLFYSQLEKNGNAYGSHFKIFTYVAFAPTSALGHYKFHAAVSGNASMCPSVITEGIFQLINFCTAATSGKCSISSLHFGQIPEEEGYILVTRGQDATWSAVVMNANGKVVLQAEGIQLSSLGSDALERFLYQPVWRKAGQVMEGFPQQGNHQPKNILIVYPSAAWKLKGQIEDHFYYCNFNEILLGRENRALAKNAWEVNTDDLESIHACFLHMSEPQEVYFLGSIHDRKEEISFQELDGLQKQSIIALMHLVKTLEKKREVHYPVLKILTNNLYEVVENEKVYPYTACVAGFAKAIGKEYPFIRTEVIDLDLESLDLEKTVLQTICGQGQGWKEWAIRKGESYLRKLIAAPLPAVKDSVFRTKGTYMIAGGAGNVGLKLSQHLAEHYSANIIWLGRSPMNESIEEKSGLIKQLGGRVFYRQVNIEDPVRLTACVEDIERSVGKINGVFHSAMAFQFARIAQLDETALAEALKAKVQGSMALLQVFHSKQPDFITFFSSGEAFVGNIGWSAYAAACNFEDALALFMRRRVAFPVQVINWGFWEGNDRGNEEILKAKGIYPFTAEQGMDVIKRVICQNLRQTLALHVDDSVMRLIGIELETSELQTFGKSSLGQENNIQQNPSASAPPVPTNAVPAPGHELVCNYLLGILSDVLKIDRSKIDSETDLANYGVDSLLVIPIHKAFEEAMGTLPATLTIDFRTVGEMATYLLINHQEGVTRALLTNASLVEADGRTNESKTPLLPVTTDSVYAVGAFLTSVLSKVLKIDVTKIGQDTDLATYGVDSLIVINLHKALEEELGTLPATLFLNNQTIKEIAAFLLENHPKSIRKLLAGQESEAAVVEPINLSPLNGDGVGSWHFEVIRVVEKNRIEEFLKNYGNYFREGVLNARKEGIWHGVLPPDLLDDNLVQFLVTGSNGKKVEVIMAGKGTPVLFMPAVALTAPVWYNQFAYMTDEYRVIVIHAPGYGLSETIKESNTKGVSEVFAEVIKLLYPSRPIHLVASCFGGIAAQYLASHYPEMVASLTLVGGFYDNIGIPDIDPDNLSIDEVFGMVQMVSKSLKADFDNVLTHLPQTASISSKRMQVQRFSDLLLNSQCAHQLVAMKYLNELLTLSTIEWLAAIQAPTLCMYGSYDTVVDSKASKVIHEKVAHSRLLEIDGAGHYPFLTHPVPFNEALKAFVDEYELHLYCAADIIPGKISAPKKA